jgi:nicotinamidase/pyrazinamidase
MLEGPLVFFDVDTQRDFLEPDGALYVPGATEIVPNLARLSATAARRHIPILATACSHQPGDPELQQFPPHCLAGTPGQKRIPATAHPGSVVLPFETQFQGERPPHLTLEKNELDVFHRADSGEVFDRYNEGHPLFVVYGVATDYCVRKAVKGLLERGCRAAIVVDAIRALDPAAETEILTNFARRGALLVVTKAVCDVSQA